MNRANIRPSDETSLVRIKNELFGQKEHFFQRTIFSTGLILIIGLLGNGIVLAVISNLRRRGHKTSVQLFLVNLAVSDLMVCLLCIPLTIFVNFYYPNKIAEREVGFCKLARVMQV